MKQFRALKPKDRQIVFYSEDAHSWVHFEPIISELIKRHGKKICYLTSCPDDPLFNRSGDSIKPFYIGFGFVRTQVFLTLQAEVVVMTMPDLERYFIKRSREHNVHYIYVFHSMVSSHMVFRFGAFDYYDTIFCAGPHHKTEILAWERLYNLKPKNLVKHGNSRLDSILKNISKQSNDLNYQVERKQILIAPSYGDSGLLEVCGCELIQPLLTAGYRILVRPHPLTVRDRDDVISELKRRFGEHENFSIETNVASQESLLASHLMVSDYSGAALEYVFGLERPVLFIDVPRKVNNPEYQKLNCEPFEVSIRPIVGVVVSPDQLQDVPNYVDELCSNINLYKNRIRDIRSKNIYNVGLSGSIGAEHVIEMTEKMKAKKGS